MRKRRARKKTHTVSRTTATNPEMEQQQQQRKHGPDPESLLSLSAQLLAFRDFSGARKYALMAQDSDPARTEPQQVIAIVDILLAAQTRLPATGLPDWASVLQLDEAMVGDRACMRSQFTKLVALVHPCKNRFPFSQEAFDYVCSARAAMTAEEKGKSPEESRGIPGGEGGNGKEEGEKSKGGSGTFWTVCPYCYYAYEYESAYEDCCLRCQNCRKGFHGLAVAPPQPVADGNGEGYYCGQGYFPLKYSLHRRSGGGGGDDGGKEKDGVKGVPAADFVMEISDDSLEEENGGKEKESERKKQGGSEGGVGVSTDNGQGSNGAAARNGGKTGNYRKSIPKNPRKMMMMGTGQGANETDSEGYSDSDLEFLVDDVYVSFKDMD